MRRNIPEIPGGRFEGEEYFVYDEQHVHIDGIERYRTLLNDTKTGNFVEEILVYYLKEEMLACFFIRAISCFTVPEMIFITTYSYHYETVLETVASRLCIRIRRQRCLFHIEKDLDMARKLIRYMFFQTEKNLKNMSNNMESVIKLIDGKDEREIAGIIMDGVNSPYGNDEITSHFLDFVKKHRREVFLYLENGEVEKTSDLAEQHFAIMSWLFKHQFKTKEGLLRTSYWYHRYLSTKI